jgi:phage repressor protein C with HTH and peptisase S24 domain
MDIGKRLKEFRERTRTKMPLIAVATGISKESLYKWEKGTKPSDFNLYKTLVEYLDKMDNSPELLNEDPRVNSSRPVKHNTPTKLTGIWLSRDEESIPLYDSSIAPGTIITQNDQPMLIAWRIDAPFIGEVDGAIPVVGNSMEPEFKSGSWIAIKKLRFTKIINAGNVYYVIDKNHGGVLRRVRPGSENNSIILTAENQKHGETVRKMDDVLAIFSMEAVIGK